MILRELASKEMANAEPTCPTSWNKTHFFLSFGCVPQCMCLCWGRFLALGGTDCLWPKGGPQTEAPGKYMVWVKVNTTDMSVCVRVRLCVCLHVYVSVCKHDAFALQDFLTTQLPEITRLPESGPFPGGVLCLLVFPLHWSPSPCQVYWLFL